MAYLLDANVFIEAKNRHYGLDFCPAFWEWLIRENRAGSVFSIEKVGDEIEVGEDELAEWAAVRGARFFLKPTPAMAQSLAEVAQWASLQRYEPVGARAETARELAYRLCTLCERKKRAAEALAYNGLVQSFPELVRFARESPRPKAGQGDLFGGEEG